MNENHNSNVPESEIISFIEEFIACLNYPKTQAMITKEKNIKNLQADEINHMQDDMQNEEHNRTFEKLDEQNDHQEKNNQNLMSEKSESEIKEDSKGFHEKLDQKENSKLANFTWKEEEAKFYSKFASFSEIICCLESASAASMREKLNNSLDKNNEVKMERLESKPSLLNIFSALDTIEKLKKFTIPVHRTFSIEPKFSKFPKFLEASPREHFLVVIDENSCMILVNLSEKLIIQTIKVEENEEISSARWLNSGNEFITGTVNGKMNIYKIQKDQGMNKECCIHPHQSDITAIYCNKNYLYSCSTDFTISKISIQSRKIERTTQLKGSWLKQMTKIEHKRLKEIIFGIDRRNQELLMTDEITGFSTTIFSIGRDHLRECQKLQDENLLEKHVLKSSWIEDVLTNIENDSLIVSVGGVNPSIYEIDPLRNDCIVRLNHLSLRLPFFSTQEHTDKKRRKNLHMCLSHKCELLTISVDSSIFYVRIKNWRILHEYVEPQGKIKFGQITSTRRYAGTDDEKVSLPENLSLCLCNIENGNIEVYENEKSKLKIIRNEVLKERSLFSMGIQIPAGAQGFLELLQTIRENYQTTL